MTIICPYDELTLVKILERQLSFSYCEIVHSPDLGQNPFSFKNFDDFLKEFHTAAAAVNCKRQHYDTFPDFSFIRHLELN